MYGSWRNISTHYIAFYVNLGLLFVSLFFLAFWVPGRSRLKGPWASAPERYSARVWNSFVSVLYYGFLDTHVDRSPVVVCLRGFMPVFGYFNFGSSV